VPPPIWLDNAATTHKPQSGIDATFSEIDRLIEALHELPRN
jgi:selenocysteine lyase/cysteine desulfurase